MKKETVITAIVFFGVGFLAGYFYDAQRTANRAVPFLGREGPPGGSIGETQAKNAEGPSDNSASPQLPAGHPPINQSALIRLLQDEAAQNPNDSRPALQLANLFYDQRRFPKAIEWYQKVLELEPKNVEARTDLGTSYFGVGRPGDALREFRKSLQINPRHEPTLYNMIIVNLEGTHDLAAAEQAWERLHDLNPNYPGLTPLRQSIEAARAANASGSAKQ